MIKQLFLAVSATAVLSAAAAPGSLTCEHLADPLGVNTLSPRLSWKNAPGEVKSQSAYEILVGTDSLALTDKGTADMWRSGKVKSPESVLVPYAGSQLAPRGQYWWKVRVWNEKGHAGAWSPTARFGVGILADSPMQGRFIGLNEDDGDPRAPILRKTVTFSEPQGRVMAHVNSLGYHELYVNGVKAGRNVLTPGVSQLDKRSLIVTYDITPLLHKGDNDIAVRLGQGWYKPTTYKAQYPGPVVRVEIDGVKGGKSTLLAATDNTWQAAASGRADTGSWNALRFGGERVDGAVEPAEMTPAQLAALKWHPAGVFTPSQEATPDMAGSNHIAETAHAVKVTPAGNGQWIADMGRVRTGWFALDMPVLPKGTKVTMEYADNLKPDGGFDASGEADEYICAGREGERFCNRFNHHAYRYVRISGLDSAPAPEACTAMAVQGEYQPASTFRCSDPDLNAVHDMVNYTMRCLTFSGYMVDCPHLERTGYGGDGNSSTMTLQTMYDVAPTYANWLQAWGDVMDPDGSLPHVAPAGGGGGGPYWCAFIVLAPWRTWINYGDRRVLEEYYPLMKRWMGYVDANSRDGLLRRWPDTANRVWYLGDWLAPAGVDAGNPASVDLVNNCVVSDCLDKMERIATELGLDDEAAQWRSKRLALNAAIHYNFYDRANAQYATGSQLDMSYPMLTGAVPSELRGKVSDRLLDLSATQYRGHIGAGLVGVPIITQWAVDERKPDFMAGMLRQHDYPGYLYMIDNGATATWESWDAERSRVHNCYNGIGTWFYQGVGGIRPDEAGYRSFTVSPQAPEGVEWAEVTKETPYGTIALRWERGDDGALTGSLTVPPGTRARIPSASGAVTLDAGTHSAFLTFLS